MNKIDKLLTLFCYNEVPACDREWMRNPMLHEGHVYATNAEVMLKVPVFLCSEQYAPANPPEGKKSFNAVEANFKPLKEPVIIPLENITEVLSRIEKVPGRKNCTTCKGTGEVEDEEFNKEYDLQSGFTVGCLDCEGYGTIEDTTTLVYPDPFTAVVKLNKTYLAAPYFALLEKACKATGNDTVTITAAWSFKDLFFGYVSLMFQIGEVTVVLVSLGYIEGESEPAATVYKMNIPALTPVNH